MSTRDERVRELVTLHYTADNDEKSWLLAEAQIEATLALEEQQRIANLIAALPSLDNTVTVDTWDMDRPMPTERDRALEAIREGVGL